MPTDLPEDIIIEKNKEDSSGAWVYLLDVTLSDDTVLNYVNNPTAIRYPLNQTGETTYQPLEFLIGEIENKKGGRQGTTITIINEELIGIILPYIDAYEGLVGSTVLVTPLHTDYPSIDYSNKSVEFEVMKTSVSEKQIDIVLGTLNPLTEVFPTQTYFGNYCRYVKYFKEAPCNYSGSETTCNGTLARCTALGNQTRFGGCINLASKTSKYS